MSGSDTSTEDHADGCICYWCIARDISLGVESGVLELIGVDSQGRYLVAIAEEEPPWQ